MRATRGRTATLPLPTPQVASGVQDPVSSSVNPAGDAARAGLPGGVHARVPGPHQGPAESSGRDAGAGRSLARSFARARPGRGAHDVRLRGGGRLASSGADGQTAGRAGSCTGGRLRGGVWRSFIPGHRGVRCLQPGMAGSWGDHDFRRRGARTRAVTIASFTAAWRGPAARPAALRLPPWALPRRATLPTRPAQPPPPCQAVRRRDCEEHCLLLSKVTPSEPTAH